MDRAASIGPGMQPIMLQRSCRKIHSNYTHVVARCKDIYGGKDFEDLEMKREKSAAPDWMVESMRTTSKRQKCNKCSKPPEWKTEDGTESMPHGPEVSYGIPFRWSASRLLAADLKAMVCGSRHNNTEECNSLLNIDAWKQKSGFAERYMTGTMPSLISERLVHEAVVQPSIGEAIMNFSKSLLEEDEDMFLWSGETTAPGWVACNQMNGTCYGKISKKDWYNRDTRGAMCNRVFEQASRDGKVNSSAVGLDICNLNNKTNNLCQILQSARVRKCIFVSREFSLTML